MGRFTMKLNQYTWIVGLYFFVNGCNARSSMRADVVSATMGGETTTTVRAETTTTTTNYPPNGCPTGWVDSQDRGCFLFHYTQADNWFEAQHECERVGGFLAEPKTYEQATLLTSLALLEESIIGVNSWWIGLSDLGHDGRWLWQHPSVRENGMMEAPQQQLLLGVQQQQLLLGRPQQPGIQAPQQPGIHTPQQPSIHTPQQPGIHTPQPQAGPNDFSLTELNFTCEAFKMSYIGISDKNLA